jgi:DNA repair protein RadA/Sms
VVGWDSGRLAMLLAVLEARCGLNFSSAEVYLNVAGGYRLPIRRPTSRWLQRWSRLWPTSRCRTMRSGSAKFRWRERSARSPILGNRLREAAKLGFGSAFGPGEAGGKVEGSRESQLCRCCQISLTGSWAGRKSGAL